MSACRPLPTNPTGWDLRPFNAGLSDALGPVPPEPPRGWGRRLEELLRASQRLTPAPAWFTPVHAYFGSFETCFDPARYRFDGMKRQGPQDLPHVYFQFTVAGYGCFEEYGRPPQRVTPGRAFFALIPSRHRYYLPPGSPGWTYGWIGLFHPYLLSRITRQVRASGPLVETPPSCPLIQRAVRLVRGAFEKDFRDRLEVEESLLAFVHAFERMVEAGRSAEAEGLLRAVRQRVLADPARPFLVEDFAVELGTTRTAFSHSFRKRTGMTPAHYATEVRIAEAARLLTTTSLPLREIAARCGFANANHFGKVFRRFRQQSPDVFRSYVR